MFFFEFLQGKISDSQKEVDSQAEWYAEYDKLEKARQKRRIWKWRDSDSRDEYAINAEEPVIYIRSSLFGRTEVDPTGKNTNRNHQYLYNLKVLGHKTYTRRDPNELQKAQAEVDTLSAAGRLGPLSPF
uniref:NUOP5 n=1 Tax=Polytomella sp. Pringsheim 198.80 TaxID=37502 RepID=UPI001720595A|nr:Chain i, NUOP5 [Polytomella sp. Pringsheim 198.80]7ARD_i Chain i, NUOP5 [Polytomella sp. Pringsheim 198.80]|mmetsp:Transcript_19145/g.34642  ORF Transcript_19145/g.34642 Transcript_19145/m.34642 type:complete len:129 (-) Transcript_19145:1167-1553(-)|eukprot:CAMPEP_0175076582 /NCGR_PEP_ID=MMETSP0052_2-20121109/22818_1 /TAXON_ID=51329 ORGANISM="Polytomella parva, Strain SAG 63-3" /NCGR_SAMPLE_ID=MMETSP0052_2 /ASSEMBLY_ACC=CAM_ASM_000194 /LENGTH=128 /DNA_ID=CAMNT_0016345759 /DNA_START=59 /DNA_END=445 /DNA_ORIENTATION=+